MEDDFRICRATVGLLEKFKVKTDLVLMSTKPMTHWFFREICDMYKRIREWSNPQFFMINNDMINKYDKYWGNIEKLNEFLYVVVVLDSRLKFEFLQHAFERLIKFKIP